MSFGDELRRLARELPEAVEDVLVRTRDDALATARKYSGGTATRNTLRRADHPYAKRHGSPRLNPAYVNRQDGDFYEGWDSDGPAPGDRGDLQMSVFNTDPVGELYLEPGTETMFARPLGDAIAAEVEPRLEQRLDQAMDRLIGG